MIVNALAPALNTMPLTSVGLAEMETLVILEDANVAVSDGPLGGPPAVQFVAVFQSPVAGLANHVALPAWLVCVLSRKMAGRIPAISVTLNKRSALGLGIISCLFMGLFSFVRLDAACRFVLV